MQRSLFSCVTQANLDSDSVLQPTTLESNANTLSHAGSAGSHVRGLLWAEYFKHQFCGQKGPGPGATPIIPFPQRYKNVLF